MAEAQASFTLQTRNPDVLSCIANLSNDEVFTPPELANRMLDAVAEGWAEANDGANISFCDSWTVRAMWQSKSSRAGLGVSVLEKA